MPIADEGSEELATVSIRLRVVLEAGHDLYGYGCGVALSSHCICGSSVLAFRRASVIVRVTASPVLF